MEAGAGGRLLSDHGAAVSAALTVHPAVEAVTLTGSRAEGRSHELSDWDFVVEPDDFAAVATDLPRLFEPLAPLAQQWRGRKAESIAAAIRSYVARRDDLERRFGARVPRALDEEVRPAVMRRRADLSSGA